MFAKCANRVCSEEFDYHLHGIFFRFSRQRERGSFGMHPVTAGDHSHNVEHYWLCGRCARTYRLAFIEGAGVALVLRETGFPAPMLDQTVAA